MSASVRVSTSSSARTSVIMNERESAGSTRVSACASASASTSVRVSASSSARTSVIIKAINPFTISQ